MIFRLLLLFAIVWFLIWLIRKQMSNQSPKKPRLRTDQSEDMVACDYCGTHVPKSLVVHTDSKNYCCEEHARLDDH